MYKKIVGGLSIGLLLLTVWNPLIADEETDNLKKTLVSIFKEEPSSIKKTPVPGVFEVGYGMELLYVSSDGKYFFNGDMYNLKSRQNLTEKTRSAMRKAVMDAYDQSKAVTFKADDEKHVISVFTDIDCPYCVKLHNEVPELNKKGITVQYLFYPRAGLGSPSFKKAESVWCNEDQNTSMTRSKNRETVESKSCDSPVAEQFKLGHELGVTGTPAIITEKGTLIPGYSPAKVLAATLDKEKSQ